MKQMTAEQAIRFYESGRWKHLSDLQITKLQIGQDRLCVPFQRFHEALAGVLQRPVFTHEFAERDQLQGELEGRLPKRTVAESLNSPLVRGKKIVVEVTR